MKYIVNIYGAAINLVPQNTVGMIVGLTARPMKRLPWVMLIIPDLGHPRYISKRIWEIIEQSSAKRYGLSIIAIGR